MGIFSLKEALPENPSAQIEVDGKPVYILPLDKDRTVYVKGPKGRTSIEIKNHKVRITESPCPNKLCIEQGWIEKGCLICLPNKVVVTIRDREEKKPAVDAITG